jgi:hypothetical protein
VTTTRKPDEPLWSAALPLAEDSIAQLFLFTQLAPEHSDDLRQMKDGVLFLLGFMYYADLSAREQSAVVATLDTAVEKGIDLMSRYLESKN